MTTSDRVLRAITDDGAFRVIAAVTTDTVRAAIAAQAAKPAHAGPFGELLTGAVLVREAMAPNLRVQVVLRGEGGRGSLVADSHPEGKTRGLVNFGQSGEPIGLGAGALVQVMRTMPNRSLHEGIVAVPEGAGVSGALMAYMTESEQVSSVIAVRTLFEGGELRAAGGFMVQLLPEVERGPLMIMTTRLEDFQLDDFLRAGMSPEELLAEILHGMEFTRVGDAPVCFECGCSHVKVLASLATIDRAEVADMIRVGEPLEITCDYCNRKYEVRPAELTALLAPS
jgi:molecular chaperone Hsp33